MMKQRRSISAWLILIVVAQTVALLAVLNIGPGVAAARADGIPDAGAQQQQVIDQLKDVNAKLDRLITLLNDGKMQVTLRKPEDAGRNH